jgi:hypothetical protein
MLHLGLDVEDHRAPASQWIPWNRRDSMRDDGGIRDSETNDGMCRGGVVASDCALEVIGRNLETALLVGWCQGNFE